MLLCPVWCRLWRESAAARSRNTNHSWPGAPGWECGCALCRADSGGCRRRRAPWTLTIRDLTVDVPGAVAGRRAWRPINASVSTSIWHQWLWSQVRRWDPFLDNGVLRISGDGGPLASGNRFFCYWAPADLWSPLFPGSREQCDGELEPWFQNIWLQRYDGLARFAERSHHIDGRSCDCNRICRDDVHERGTIF